MPALFALTMFLSATLLFMVQPMVGKMVLPHVGGNPAVWNTCMVFFQALLLLGYWYAHKLTKLPSLAKQVAIHTAVLASAGAALLIAALLADDYSTVPIAKSLAPEGGALPFISVISMLALAIGLPFLAVSTSAPLLQRWFTVTASPNTARWTVTCRRWSFRPFSLCAYQYPPSRSAWKNTMQVFHTAELPPT